MRVFAFLLFAAWGWAQTAPMPAEYLGELRHAGGQVVELAKAIPAEKYSWRPGPGVRSVSELFMHLATGNSLLLGQAGAEAAGSIDIPAARKMETAVTNKQEVIAELERTLKAVAEAYQGTTPEQLNRKIKFFGGPERTVAGVYLRILVHLNEHMGQAVAYARVNGIVPPWSAGQ